MQTIIDFLLQQKVELESEMVEKSAELSSRETEVERINKAHHFVSSAIVGRLQEIKGSLATIESAVRVWEQKNG